MPLSPEEKAGIADLLAGEEQNVPILMILARSITKNITDVASSDAALHCIYTHITDSTTLLYKRHITKDMLFKYLHHREVPVTLNFTKQALIDGVLSYWKTMKTNNANITIEHIKKRLTNQAVIPDHATSQQLPGTVTDSVQSIVHNSTEYPIHQLARMFAKWFFENYNKEELKASDFWPDANLKLRIEASDLIDEHDCCTSEDTICILMTTKQKFEFLFNPNISHEGVQGRINPHGLVLVLACGTLHTVDRCVGVFEFAFGLLRDPYTDNNWKIKTLQSVFRSRNTTESPPMLVNSTTLSADLSLPVSSGELL